MAERAHHHHQLGTLEGPARGERACAVELGLRVQHEIRAPRRGEHRFGVQPVAQGPRTGELRADAVRGLAQEPERGARDRRQCLRERVKLRGVGMLFGEIAEEHGAPGARQELVGDGPRGLRRLEARDAVERRRHRPPCGTGSGDHDLRERRRQLRWRHDGLVRDGHQPVVVDRTELEHPRAALRRLAQSMGDQRVVVAQEAADDEHSVEASQLRRSACRASAPPAGHRGSRPAASGNRRCRSRGRASAVRGARAPRASRAATPARRGRFRHGDRRRRAGPTRRAPAPPPTRPRATFRPR